MAALLDDAPADALVGEAEDGDEADDDLAGGEGEYALDQAEVSGDARLECPAPGCGRSFKCVANLAAHRRSHGAAVLALAGFNGLPAPLPAGDGKFHCSVDGCPYGPGGKTLANKKSARQHWAQRHAEKLFFCSHPGCGASFGKAHQLNRHTQNTHGSFKCQCGVSFGSRHALNKHTRHFNAQSGVAPDTHAEEGDGAAAGGAPGGAGGAGGEEEEEDADGDDAAALVGLPEPPSADAVM